MSGRREVCRACAYWAPFPPGDGLEPVLECAPLGECRAVPPETMWFVDQEGAPAIRSRWPQTRAEHWCGEWFPGRPDDE